MSLQSVLSPCCIIFNYANTPFFLWSTADGYLGNFQFGAIIKMLLRAFWFTSFGEHTCMTFCWLVSTLGHGSWICSALVGAVKWFSNVHELNQLIECETPGDPTCSGVVSPLHVSHSNRPVVAAQGVLISISLILPCWAPIHRLTGHLDIRFVKCLFSYFACFPWVVCLFLMGL